MVVQNLHCTGCHGISVGSLGQYEGEIDIVENIYVYNVDMTSCGDSARIKVWPGAPAGSASSSGGGTGLVRNITYNGLSVHSNDGACLPPLSTSFVPFLLTKRPANQLYRGHCLDSMLRRF